MFSRFFPDCLCNGFSQIVLCHALAEESPQIQSCGTVQAEFQEPFGSEPQTVAGGAEFMLHGIYEANFAFEACGPQIFCRSPETFTGFCFLQLAEGFLQELPHFCQGDSF